VTAEQFRCIVTDPGWDFRDSLPGPKRGAKKHYRCLSIDEIVDVHKQLIGYCVPRQGVVPGRFQVADTSWLFLWRVASMQDDALQLARALGYTVKSELVWVKIREVDTRPICRELTECDLGHRPPWNVIEDAAIRGAREGRRVRIGMGRYVRNSHETCLICTRGKGVSSLRLSKSLPSVVFAPVGEHSAKPDVFYDLVEHLCAGPRLELFARKRRRCWTQFGDQLEAARAAE
jgi:N6-adenosine-specific RNA methylase IME4